MSKPDLSNLRACYDRVKDFPEAMPDGWTRMLELRKAVEEVLARYE